MQFPFLRGTYKFPVVAQLGKCLRLASTPPTASATRRHSGRTDRARTPAAGATNSALSSAIPAPVEETVPEVYKDTPPVLQRLVAIADRPHCLLRARSLIAQVKLLVTLQVSPNVDFDQRMSPGS